MSGNLIESWKTADCSATPFDIRPAVDATMAIIANAVATARPGQPVVAVLSENHDCSSEKILQQAIIDAAIQRYGVDNFAVGLELPHSTLATMLSEFDLDEGEQQKLREVYYDLCAYDEGNQLALKLRSELAQCFDVAYISEAHWQRYLLANLIDVGLNDVSAGDDTVFDLDDPRLQALSIPDLTQAIDDVRHPERVNASNAMMAMNIINHMHTSQVGLYFQTVGYVHMLGATLPPHHYPHAESLDAHLVARGALVVPILFENSLFEVTNYADDALLHMNKGLVVSGLLGESIGEDFAPEQEPELMDLVNSASGNIIHIQHEPTQPTQETISAAIRLMRQTWQSRQSVCKPVRA